MIDTLLTKSQDSPVTRTTIQKTTAVSVRRATTGADAVAIANISRRGFAATHQNAFDGADLARYLADTFHRHQVTIEINDANNLFLLAEMDGEIVGTVRLSQTSPPDPIRLTKPVELSRLYLQPQWLDQGIDSALMTRALEMAVAAGYQNCWLAVWEGNGRAINFYRRWGFRPAGTDALLVGQSCPIGLVMTRSL